MVQNYIVRKLFNLKVYFVKNFYCVIFYFSRHLRDFVSWLSSEPMWIYYIDCFKNSMWPKGKLAPYPPPRTDLVIFIFQFFIPLTNLYTDFVLEVKFVKPFEFYQTLSTLKFLYFFYIFLYFYIFIFIFIFIFLYHSLC